MAWPSIYVALFRKRAAPQSDPFFAMSTEMLATTTLDGRFTRVNPAFTSVLGHGQADLLSMNILDLLHPDDRAAAQLAVVDLSRGRAIANMQCRFRRAAGSYKCVEWSCAPLPTQGLAYTVLRDHARLKPENAAQPDALCVCAIENTTDAFFAVDPDWRLIRMNQQAERLWMRDRDQILGRNLWETLPEAASGSLRQLYEQVMRSGMAAHVEEISPHPPHGRWFEVHAYPQSGGLSVYLRDVTDRHQANERIKRALQEKEVLLREVHHRVKNNLQIICSMLRLQARNLHDETLLQALRDCRERVQAMAMLHDQLHRAKDFSNLNLGEYIRNLASSLFCSYGVNSADVELRMDIEDIAVSIDTAIPCGLIVNELVSNSLRHAFPGGRKGCVSLGLHARSGGRAELTVADNGRGFFKETNGHQARSLGLRLVDLLAEQIDAALTFSGAPGAVYRLVFQVTESQEVEK